MPRPKRAGMIITKRLWIELPGRAEFLIIAANIIHPTFHFDILLLVESQF